jgi:hypothetical protein
MNASARTLTAPVTATAEAMHVKGLVFQQTMAAVGRVFGPGAVSRSLAVMNPEIGDQLRTGTLVPSGWYSVSLQRAMWEGIRLATAAGPEMLRIVGREAVMETVSTVYRPLLRLLSPGTAASVGTRLWNRVYDRGGYYVTSADRNRMTTRFEGCTGFDHVMWTVLLGTVEATSLLAGARRVTVKLVGGGHDGDDWADVVTRWE